MADLGPVATRLRALLRARAEGLLVIDDPRRGLLLEHPRWAGKPWGFVAGVRPGARYVSYYLMCAYADPTLVDSVSPGLRARMQGKSCFNFTRIDEALFAELDALTVRAIATHETAVVAALAGRGTGTRAADGRH